MLDGKILPRKTSEIKDIDLGDDEAADIESLLSGAFRVLRRRKLLALAILLAFTVPAGYFVTQRPLVYHSTARLLIERDGEVSSVLKGEANTGGVVDTFLQTQLQLLRSRPTIVKTIQAVKLWESPEFWDGGPFSGTAEDISRSGLVEGFLDNLSIGVTPGTHLLDITFAAFDPDLAMRAVNALTAAYMSDQSTAEGDASTKLIGWIHDRLAEQQQKLAKSEAALQAYIATQDAVSVQDRQNIVVQKLSDLNAALTKAKTDRMSKEAWLRQLEAIGDNRAALDGLPVVLSNGALQQLRGQLAELEQKEVGMGQEFGPRHPGFVKLRSEIDLTSQRLQAELAKLTASVKHDYDAALTIERDLMAALDQQKREVVSLNQKTLDYGALERQVTSDRQIYERLLSESQMRGVAAKSTEQTIRIVEPAELPLGPVGPQNTRDLLLVIVAGVVLALAAPLAAEALDPRVKTVADIEKRLKLPCLAMVPAMRAASDDARPLMTSNSSAYSEAFRRIRAVLRPTAKPTAATRILVTSAAPGEGKSLVAANLAIALARAGQRVLLVDGDLRRPVVHKTFELDISPGLVDFLRRDANVQAIRGTTVPNLFVVTSGTKHPESAELLSSPGFQTWLGVLETRFHWIVFDSPPVGPVADACIIGGLAQHTLFVVAAGSTSVAEAKACFDQLRAAGASLTGIILNRVNLDRFGYYYSPYHKANYLSYYTDNDASELETAAGN